MLPSPNASRREGLPCGADAKDNGGAGVRPEYHDANYAAFVLSPEGQNIEVVCFEDES